MKPVLQTVLICHIMNCLSRVSWQKSNSSKPIATISEYAEQHGDIDPFTRNGSIGYVYYIAEGRSTIRILSIDFVVVVAGCSLLSAEKHTFNIARQLTFCLDFRLTNVHRFYFCRWPPQQGPQRPVGVVVLP